MMGPDYAKDGKNEYFYLVTGYVSMAGVKFTNGRRLAAEQFAVKVGTVCNWLPRHRKRGPIALRKYASAFREGRNILSSFPCRAPTRKGGYCGGGCPINWNAPLPGIAPPTVRILL